MQVKRTKHLSVDLSDPEAIKKVMKSRRLR